VPVSDVACEFVIGDTPAELAATLVDRLTAERLI
jgi:hypothetical protein